MPRAGRPVPGLAQVRRRFHAQAGFNAAFGRTGAHARLRGNRVRS